MRTFRIYGLILLLSTGLVGCGGGGLETGMPSDVSGPAPDVDMGEPPVFDMDGNSSAAAGTGL